LKYPESLHDPHNHYPLAPETVTVNKVDKLIPNSKRPNVRNVQVANWQSSET